MPKVHDPIPSRSFSVAVVGDDLDTLTEIVNDVLTFLLQVGFDKYLGARPLRKAMEKHIRFPLARHLMTHGNEALSGTLKVHAAKTGLIFST
jgi:ATP-dependent Clp protease ATP-binding subunit ClpA